MKRTKNRNLFLTRFINTDCVFVVYFCSPSWLTRLTRNRRLFKNYFKLRRAKRIYYS